MAERIQGESRADSGTDRRPGRSRSRAEELVHDLANALTSVVGRAGLVREEFSDAPTARQQVDELLVDAERCRSLFEALAAEVGCRRPARDEVGEGSGSNRPPDASFSSPTRPSPPPRRSVLVVDDEEPVRELAQAMLENLGLEATAAVDGLEAVQLVQREPERFDAVLLDLSMPGVDGVRTCAALRRCSPSLGVVVMSGFEEGMVRARFPDGGFTALLPKPFTRGELRRALVEAFGEEEPGRE